MTDFLTLKVLVVVASEFVALWIIWRLWTSQEHLFFKVSLSVFALVPVIGPLLAIWISNFPSRVPLILQDRQPRSPDVFDRWRHVHEDQNPVRRVAKWRTLMTKHRNEEP